MESPQEGGRGSAQGCWRAWACCCCPGRPGEPGGSPRCTWSHTGCWWSTPCLSWRCPPSTSPDRVPARWQPGAWRIRCSGWYGVPEQWPDGLPSQLSSLPLRTRWSSVSTTWVMPLLCFFCFVFTRIGKPCERKARKKTAKNQALGFSFLLFPYSFPSGIFSWSMMMASRKPTSQLPTINLSPLLLLFCSFSLSGCILDSSSSPNPVLPTPV